MPGVVEVERDGMIYRGEYRTEGKVVTVTYGGFVKKLTMRRGTDEAASVARQLLIKIRSIRFPLSRRVSDAARQATEIARSTYMSPVPT